MWVAYAVPKHDHHLVVEDGLGYISVGATEKEALQSLVNLFRKEYYEENERAAKIGYEPQTYRPPDEDYAIHTNEV